MGIFKILYELFNSSKKKVKVVTCGLDNSGKTTIINKLKPKKAQTIPTPTVGFSVEEFKKNNITFTVFDMSGAHKYRSLWEHYYSEAQAIIWVIDTTDKLRMVVVKDELDILLQNEALKGVPILFFANKQDIPGAMSPVECSDALELDKITGRAWNIVASNAIEGEGLSEGIKWLSDALAKLQ